MTGVRLGPILGLWWAAGTGRPGSPGQTVLEVHSGHDAAMQVLAQLRAGAERPTRGSWANGRAPGPGAQQQTGYHRPTCGQRETAESAVDGGGGVSRRAGSARRPPRSARPVREQRGGAERRQVAGTPFCRPRAGTVGFYPGGASAGGGVQEGGKAPVRSANRGAGRHSGQRLALPRSRPPASSVDAP